MLSLVLMGFLTGCAASTSGMYVAGECPQPPYASEQYVIGPGDMLNVVVWRHEEMTTTIPVRPDGKISTPLVDDISASGKTPSQLARDMEEVLAEFLRTPKVSIIVTGQGAANQIQVVGEVTTPQAQSYRDGIRVLDLIVASGGLTEYSSGNRAHIVRQSKTVQIKCQIRVRDLMSGDMSQNIEVFPGDILVVPESAF